MLQAPRSLVVVFLSELHTQLTESEDGGGRGERASEDGRGRGDVVYCFQGMLSKLITNQYSL